MISWNKLAVVFLFLCLLGCTRPVSKEEKLYKRLAELESEFWFDHSVSHVLLNRLVSKDTQVLWSTNFHTAAPVPLGAVGPSAYTNELKGIIHNDSIGRVLKQAVNDHINVILVIGDGMGNMHLALPVYMRYAEKTNKATMFEQIMREGTCGYVYTGTSEGLVTGSAASGTAIACGTKTRMNMVGVDPDGKKLESVLSVAKKNNYKTALVTDAGLTDATPAVFYAHVPDRDRENRIAQELLQSRLVDVALGGGGSRFIPRGSGLSDYFTTDGNVNFSSVRDDSLNLIHGFRKQHYQVCFNLQQLQDAPDDQKLLGLFSGGGLPAVIDRDTSTLQIPRVADMGKKALKIISGHHSSYFAMIECARIDWEAHDNDIGAVYQAVEDMNQVLETAYSFYRQDPDHTLLIFTADHETGGLEIAYRKMPEDQKMSKELVNGDVWTNRTNPLSYDQYIRMLKRQKKTVSGVFTESHSAKELQQRIKDDLGISLSNEDAELLFFTRTDYHKYKD